MCAVITVIQDVLTQNSIIKFNPLHTSEGVIHHRNDLM